MVQPLVAGAEPLLGLATYLAYINLALLSRSCRRSRLGQASNARWRVSAVRRGTGAGPSEAFAPALAVSPVQAAGFGVGM